MATTEGRKIRTGVFGGSFNPIHNGHIALARHLCQAARLDEVWLMVSPQNPLKQQAGLLDDRLRLTLARIALRGDTCVKACDYEFALPKPSYTWNTLQALSRDYPDREFTLLIGGDNWERFGQWYKAGDILSHYPVVVYPRRGENGGLRDKKILAGFFHAEPREKNAGPRDENAGPREKNAEPRDKNAGPRDENLQACGNVILAEAPLLDISSTDIRQRVRQGQDVSQMVPPPIAPLVRRFYSFT